MEKKKILILGLSKQKDFLNFLKKKEYKIIILDFYKKKNVEYVNLKNFKECLKIAIKKKIDYVITDQSDLSLKSYGTIVDKLKLPGISLKISKNFYDKLNFRLNLNKNLFLKKKNIKFFYFKNLKEFDKIKSNLKLKKKYIVKPRCSQGSRDQYIFSNFKKIKKHIIDNNLKINNYIFEEYVNGQDYAVEGFVQDGLFTLLTVSKKNKFRNSTVDQKIIYTPGIFSKRKLQLYKICQNIVSQLKLKKGLLHAEFKISRDNKVYIIEAACRGAGANITDKALNYLKSFDYKKFLFCLLTNKKFYFNNYLNSDLFLMIGWYSKFKNKKIKKVFIPSIKKFNFLKHIVIERKYINKNYHYVKDSTERLIRYIIFGNSIKDLYNKEKIIEKNIKIKYFN